MKKSLLATTFVVFPLSAKTTRLRNYGCIAIVLLAGCTSTQVRWDATKMRKDVMVYYNDQIMDNLIKAKEHLPFVHVDIQSLTSQGASQISGTIGAGESRTNTNTSKFMARTLGGLGTVANAVTRPFAYSVTPQQSETLTITAAPALGSQAVLSATPSPSPAEIEVTKETTTKDNKGKDETATEKTPKKPVNVTIYELYQNFADKHLSNDSVCPESGTFVPGTVKRQGTQYYYIDNKDRFAYYVFCQMLFTKGQTTSFERQLAAARADVEAVKSQLATPGAPR